MARCALALVMSVLFLPSTLALAQVAPTARALASTFNDPALQWGPCPAFMPEGCAIAVLHGDPSKDNADVFFKVPAGAHITRHWHTSAERMVLVSGELRVTYDGQAEVVLKAGTYAYGPAHLPHAADCVSEAPCVLAIAFEAPVDAFAGDYQPR